MQTAFAILVDFPARTLAQLAQIAWFLVALAGAALSAGKIHSWLSGPEFLADGSAAPSKPWSLLVGGIAFIWIGLVLYRLQFWFAIGTLNPA